MFVKLTPRVGVLQKLELGQMVEWIKTDEGLIKEVAVKLQTNSWGLQISLGLTN